MKSEMGKIFFREMLNSEKTYKPFKGDNYKISELKNVLYRESVGECIKDRHESGLLKCAVLSFIGARGVNNHNYENDHLTGELN